jgi:hypothetical protein
MPATADIMGMRSTFLVACGLAAALFAQDRPCHAADENAARAAESAARPAYRFAITPSWSHAFVTRSVSHEAVGLTLQTFFDKRSRFGIALVGALYSPFPRDYTNVPASYPLSETLGALLAELGWTFLHGERAELALSGGLGAVGTRPVSLVDPSNRKFAYQGRLAYSGGVVARVYLTREAAVSLEARSVVYIDTPESDRIAARDRSNESTWFGNGSIIPMVETRVGLTVFLSAREP